METSIISDELKIYELSLIWKEAEYNFAFWERLNGTLDWDKAYREALPAVLKTTTLYDYYMELSKFVALLRDGHTGVSLPQALDNKETACLPFCIDYIQGEHVIPNMDKSVKNDIPRYSILKKINGIDINSYIK